MYAIRFDMRIVKQQEVVTYVFPVEVFATTIKILISKILLDCSIVPFEGLDLQGFKEQRYGNPK